MKTNLNPWKPIKTDMEPWKTNPNCEKSWKPTWSCTGWLRVITGGYRRLPGGSDHFSWHTDKHCIIIYIIIITIIWIFTHLANVDWDALPHVVGCCAPSLRTEFELIGWLGDHLCFSPRRKESWGGLVAGGHQACLLYPATESRMERRMAWQSRWCPCWQVRGWTGSSKISPRYISVAGFIGDVRSW